MAKTSKERAREPAVEAPAKRGRGRPPKTDRVYDDDEKSSGGIRAMVVGLSVLRAVGLAYRPQPLREIAAAAGLAPSRAHRYLSSLVASGYVRQDPNSGNYALGEATAEIGLLALGQIDAIEIGTEALNGYGELSGLDGHLAVWGSHGPTVVRWRSGRNGLQMRVQEGRVLPVLWTATGRLFAAYQDGRELAQLLDPEIAAWNKERPDQRLDRATVEAIFADIRRAGVSSTVVTAGGKRVPMFAPVNLRPEVYVLDTAAVPLFDHTGKLRMALTFFGTDRIAISDKPERVDELIKLAQGASRKLGHTPILERSPGLT